MFVTCYNDDKFDAVYEMAKSLLPENVTPAMDSPVNSYKTFAIMPSGSKLGWDDAEKHDKAIQTLINYIRMYDDEDSNPFEYIVTEYGQDLNDRRKEEELLKMKAERDYLVAKLERMNQAEYHHKSLDNLINKMQQDADVRGEIQKLKKSLRDE
jgi:hypothetical protein